MRYERVKVTRDTSTVHNVSVAPWEIPLIEFIFDEGNVVRTDEFQEVDREYPHAAKELDRLVRAYGADPKSGVAYANSVYGNARAGERTLAKMIDEAKASDAAEEKAPTPAPATKRSRKAAVATDDLLS